MSWSLSSLIAQLRETNEPLEAEFRCWLDAQVSSSEQLPRLLNMFSLMEHVGSRKIMLSQMHGGMSCETLKHLAEETRHAYFFKRHAERYAGRKLDYSGQDTLCPLAATLYLQRLDQAVLDMAQPEWPTDGCYLIVSLLIELRAVWAYQMLQIALQKASLSLSLKSLIAEEDLHLEQMNASATKILQGNVDLRDVLIDTEQEIFLRLWGQLQRTGGRDTVAA